MKSVQDLFGEQRDEWLEEARAVARELLRERSRISIEDVLKECPRPQYVHRNTAGSVFRDNDFMAVGWIRSARPLMNGRQVRTWTLRDGA